MNPDFPHPPQPIHGFFFLTPYEHHQSIVHSLDSQVYLATSPGSWLPPLEELVALLRIRYGGSARHWRQTKVIGGVLLTLPPWLRPDALIDDSGYWETGWGLQMLPWQCIDNPAVLPILDRVQIIIHDFPIEFWHLHYFKQATAAMGVIMGFGLRHSAGRDKDGVTLFLDCPDTILVPYWLHIDHPNGHWSRCKVELHGRPPLPELNTPQAPPPPPDIPLVTSVLFTLACCNSGWL